MDDLNLRLRDALEHRAAQADTSPVVVARVLPSPHRRTTRWPLLAAAASLLLVVGGVAALTRGGSAPTSPPGPQEREPATVVEGGWRTEVWRGVEVKVPRDWGWGGAPMPDFVPVGEPASTELIDCGASAYRTAGGRALLNGDPTLPYVGRPVMQTDACQMFDPSAPLEPRADFVWFGVPMETGALRVGDHVLETVTVAGTTVTVATTDRDLRAAILSTVAVQRGDCPAQVGGQVGAPPQGMAVCAYDRGDLVYATEVGAAAVEEFEAAWRAGMTDAVVDCFMGPSDERVLLATRDQVYDVRFGPGCPVIVGRGVRKLLVEENTEQWAVDGIPAYVVGPWGGKGATGGFFRGMLG